ncbi:ornithine cyclodeaminase [Acidovorax sp. GBBC 3334]|uniref:ornithine cyclodeaminase n=1 Tax=Acidovorax sp. GBBC 3334 TaxID=2940496 RepID=UPI002304683E|nr:ornithine cyclodeaminase [Acidovorax sp. GBBC 3334]MDA8455743.1 ornithine cyclodeaminase [Acidovorax sp. GBBC 3334]
MTRAPRPAALTEFLDAPRAAELVGRTGVIACIRAIAQAIEADFLRWDDFDKTARTAAHSPRGVIELMPVADTRAGGDYAFKYVNGHPANPHGGLPTVMAFGALAAVDTGLPVFLGELTLTTALRTAAASAVAARRLARTGNRSMALIGNGSQAEFQALAFFGLLGVRELRLFDTDPAATRKLMANLAPYAREGLRCVPCASTREAVRGAGIVTTVTADKARATVIETDMLEPGMHLNAVGGDCPGKTELAPGVLRAAGVFVEYEPQTRIEGDLQQMPAEFAVTELWRVLAGLAPGRTADAQVTVFDSVGFALEDYSALRTMRALGQAAGLLERIALVPALADPKDLYAQLRPWLAENDPGAAPAAPRVPSPAHEAA